MTVEEFVRSKKASDGRRVIHPGFSSLQTATSEVPPTAEAKILTNASDLNSYFENVNQKSINMKPNAIKNELNASLHLITFLSQSASVINILGNFNSRKVLLLLQVD